jgi:lysophospholipase L1-like esterase
MPKLNDAELEIRVLQESKKSLSEQSNEEWFEFRKQQFPNAFIGIAEGDSWFDYPPAWISDISLGDLINQLNQRRKVNLLRIAKAGDTLENMTFGNNSNNQSNQLTKTLHLIEKHQPDFFLFSGTGNDVAGPDGLRFEPFINNVHSKLDNLKKDYLDFMVNQVFAEMFEYLIQSVIDKKSDIHIFLHGYGYPIPDGRAVIEIGDFKFLGPWFEPALKRKGLSQDQGKGIVKQLIDSLNEMLINLSNKYCNNVHFIDLRRIIEPNDWENELHPTAKGFKKIADEFEKKILNVLQAKHVVF